MSRIYNQSLAHLITMNPDKLSAVGTVPLAHPDKAAEVLNEAMNMGLKGAIIGPGIDQHMLSDRLFSTIFRRSKQVKSGYFHSSVIM